MELNYEKVFNQFDLEGDGFLDVKELHYFFSCAVKEPIFRVFSRRI